MDARETLRQHPRVNNDDIDDIVGIAEELQQAARREADGASVAEVQAVAGELDIDPRFVEEAITVLQRRRDEAEAAQSRAAEERAASAVARGRLLAAGAAVLAGIAMLGGLVFGGGALSGAASVSAAQDQVSAAETQLDVVLDRQAALVPQLVALAGGEAGALQRLATSVRDAPSTEARLEASAALGTALGEVLATLPPTDGEAAAQQRRDLQHELAGAQNRIATEQRRYQAARAELERVRGSLTGGWARALGMVE